MTYEEFKRELKAPKRSFTRLQALWSTLRSMGATIATYGEENDLLRDQLKERVKSPESERPDKRSAKMPDPPKLSDGKNPTFDGWYVKIKNKLRVNADYYPTEDDKIAYIFDRTEGDAATHLEPRMTDNLNPFKNAGEVLEYLRTIYVDPHRELNAREEYRTLIMGRLDFHDFHTKFRQLATRAAIPTASWKDDLFSKLTFDMQRALMP